MTETIKRSLRYDFTAVEIHDLSLELAKKTKELSALTEEKKTVVSQYGARLNEVKATTNKLSNQVSDGWEFRDIECTVEYHKPQQGKKTIIRKDTDKVAMIETMSEYDHNLFNQPQDEKSLGQQLRDDLAEHGMEIMGGNGSEGSPVVIKTGGKKRRNK
jgi:hypothetical protein